MAGIVLDVFAGFLVTLASQRAEIPRGEEGIEVVVLCVVFGHGEAQVAHKGRTGPGGEERARKRTGWREGQAGRAWLRTGLELVYSL
jgi:hypothetical protein